MKKSLLLFLFFLFSVLPFAQYYGIPPGVRSGTIAGIPGTCSIGNWYWATNATAGDNLYFCTSTNTWTAVAGSGGGGTVSAGTQNQVGKYAVNGTTISGSTILSDDATNAYVDGPLDIKQNSLVIEISNSGSPGTTINKLAKIPAAVASVLTTSAADQISAIGVVIGGAGTTGSAKIGVLGQFSCLFDNTATTAGDFITPSATTAATCHDAGTAYPTTGEVMGQILSTHASCGSPPCGPYTVLFGTPDVFLPGAGGSNGNNGNGNGNKISTITTSSPISGGPVASGPITIACATCTVTIASGAKALATGAISSAACTTAQTDTATGTATTDAIIATFNADPTAVTGYVPLTTGMLTIIPYPTTNTVNFKVCNNTASSITPGAITINWRVVR